MSAIQHVYLASIRLDKLDEQVVTLLLEIFANQGMKMGRFSATALAFCIVILVSCILQAENSGYQKSDRGIPAGIVWYGVLADGMAEARATGKPIMLLSAVPQCAGVPGMW